MAVFLLVAHLIGVGLLFMMIAIELTGLCAAPRATTVAQLRGSTYAGPAIERLAPVATVIIAGSGLWMVAYFDFLDFGEAWVIISIIATAVLAVMGSTVQGRHLNRLREEAMRSADGPVTPELAELARNLTMHTAGWGSVGATGAFLYVMVDHPGVAWAILAFVIGPALGIAAGLAALNSASTPSPAAPSSPSAPPAPPDVQTT